MQCYGTTHKLLDSKGGFYQGYDTCGQTYSVRHCERIAEILRVELQVGSVCPAEMSRDGCPDKNRENERSNRTPVLKDPILFIKIHFR